MKALLVFSGVAALTTFSHAWFFADSEMPLDAWTLEFNPAYGEATVTHGDYGGLNGGYAWINLSVNTTQGNTLIADYYRPDYTYDPSSQGALTTLYFSQDGEGGGGYVEQANYFLIIQDGKKFYSGPYFYDGRGGTFHWTTFHGTFGFSDFTAADSSHPDFSSQGSVMTFGIMRSLPRNVYFNSWSNGFDNFYVGDQAVPEPASVVLLATGVAVVVRRRLTRKSRSCSS